MQRKRSNGPPADPPARGRSTAPATGLLAAWRARCPRTGSAASRRRSASWCCWSWRPASAGRASDDYSLPGAESQEAIDLFQAHSPAFGGVDSTLVFTVDDGRISDPAPKAAIEGALAKVRELDGVELAASPFEPGGQVSEDRRLASVDVRYSSDPAKIEKADGEALIAAGETAEPEVQVEARGVLIDLASEQEAPVGELIGVLIAIVLLTLLFRSGAAMGATLIGALVGVAAGQILLGAVSAPLGLPTFAAVIAMMLGLGAGIDYSLLIIGRYREQRAAGDSMQEAAARAAATAGATVVAAGLIVMVAIAGLLVVGVPFIGKMGLGAAIAIGAVVVSALTILPIMIGAFGRRLVPKKPEHVHDSPAFTRWGEIVTGRPWASIAAGVAVLLVFAAPGHPDAPRPARRRQPARVAHAARRLRPAHRARSAPGSNGPFLLAVDTPKGAPETEQQLGALQQAVAGTPGIAAVPPASVSEDGEMATIFAIPTTAPQDAKTSDLLDRLRDDVIPAATAGTPLKVYVGGNTAALRGRHGQGRRAPAAVHLGRDRPVGAAAGDGVPLAVDPARLGGLQPAVGRGRLRRGGGGVPGGHRREPDRRRLGHPDHLVPAGHAVRDPVRAEHGLQRLPAQPDPRGLQRGRRPSRERDPRDGPHRQGRRLRRPDHGRGVPELRHRRAT